MAKHEKKPKIKVKRIVKFNKVEKVSIFNTFLLIGLYFTHFYEEILTFTKGILLLLKGL